MPSVPGLRALCKVFHLFFKITLTKSLQCIPILPKIKAKLHSRVCRTQRDLYLPSYILCLPPAPSKAVLCASEAWNVPLSNSSLHRALPRLPFLQILLLSHLTIHDSFLLFRCWDKSHLTTESFFEKCLKTTIILSQIILCAFLSKTQHIFS